MAEKQIFTLSCLPMDLALDTPEGKLYSPPIVMFGTNSAKKRGEELIDGKYAITTLGEVAVKEWFARKAWLPMITNGCLCYVESRVDGKKEARERADITTGLDPVDTNDIAKELDMSADQITKA